MVLFQAEGPVKRGQVKDLLVPELRLTTVLLWFIWSVLSITALYLYYYISSYYHLGLVLKTSISMSKPFIGVAVCVDEFKS